MHMCIYMYLYICVICIYISDIYIYIYEVYEDFLFMIVVFRIEIHLSRFSFYGLFRLISKTRVSS